MSIYLLVIAASKLLVLVSSAEQFSKPDLVLRKHGESCKVTECDESDFLVCDTRDYLCKCQNGMVYRGTDATGIFQGKCVKKVGDICKIVITFGRDRHFPCTPDAFCDDKSQVCVCGHYKTVDGHCDKYEDVSKPCRSTGECGLDEISASRLMCHNGTCSCNPSESVYATVTSRRYYNEISKLCAPLPTKNCFKGFCAPGAKCSGRYSQYHDQYENEGAKWTTSATCRCSRPFELNSKTLRCTSPYSQICTSTIPCNDGLICGASGLCECMPSQHYDLDEKKCINRIGGICNKDVGCAPNAECHTGICACKSFFVRDGNDSCVGEFGASCQQERDCDKRRNDLVCDGGNCVCKPGRQMSLTTNRCLLGYNSRCRSSDPCYDKMECKNSFCRCIDGTHYDRIRDECEYSVGEVCDFRNNCGTNADCQNKICRCNGGYVATPSGACAADFGTACQSDADCSQTTNSLICKNGTCACEADHEMSPTTKLCSLEHGAPCDGSMRCFDSLVCNGTCTCPQGQFLGYKLCFSFAGHSCNSATDCVSNADCFNQACTCKKGYVQSSQGFCIPDFGSPCLSNADCDQSRNKLICDQVCRCPLRLKMSNETGQCSHQFNDFCDGSIPCGDGLICRQKQCRCPMKTQIFDMRPSRCLHRAGGGPCNETANCFPGTFCSDKSAICDCMSPFELNPKTSQCSSAYNKPCNASFRCLENLYCDATSSTCKCRLNQYYDSKTKRCHNYVTQACTSSIDCATDADCMNSVCKCREGYLPSRFGGCAAEFGTSCNLDADCDQTTNQLVCSQQKCACEPNSRMVPHLNRCLLKFESRCEGYNPCVPPLVCSEDGTCQCPIDLQTYNYTSGHCMSKFFGNCKSDEDCFEGLFCDFSVYRGVCNCTRNDTVATVHSLCVQILDSLVDIPIEATVISEEKANKSSDDTSDLTTILAGGFGVFAMLCCLGCGAYYRIKLRRAEVAINKLTDEDIDQFRNGNVRDERGSNCGNLNQDAALEAYQLPYNNSFEFPFEKLQFGPILGSGAFGTVYKAEAQDIEPEQRSTTVAVKTVSPNVEVLYLKALMKELKLMMFIGNHENVARLLGACTEKLKDRIVYAIVEFCELGNVLDFLHSNRNEFIANLAPKKRNTEVSVKILSDAVESVAHEELGKSRSSKNAVVENGVPLEMTSLIRWCYHVASGMHYLSSRHVVHSDLAARNVLLTAGNVAKVADFGLSRQMYEDQNYVKKTKCPLPFKWMALESITRMEFSSASDVWSYGVFCWEVFTLGNVPYPGETWDANFLRRLEEGYRLQKPTYATDLVFREMKNCWESEPSVRPTFSDLADFFKQLAEVASAEGYENEPEIRG